MQKVSSGETWQNEGRYKASDRCGRGTLNLNKAVQYELQHGRKLDLSMDPKKLRRTVSNRLSAHRSRLRKAQYIDDMEKQVDQLKETIIKVMERVEKVREQSKLVREQNEDLQRLLHFRMNEAIHSQKMIDKNRAELGVLKAQEKDLRLRGSWSSGHEYVKLVQMRRCCHQSIP